MKRLIYILKQIKAFFIRIVRRSFLFIKYVIDSHNFFTRKSQHYIMGNWAYYESKDYRWNNFNKPQKAKNYRYYKTHYLKAYIKFMMLSLKDAIRINYA